MKVSIIIPAYNVECYISRTLRSCIEQIYENIEIVVVNDGSTDRTGEIIAGFDDPRIVKLTQINKGVSAARNMGLQTASGDFCLFLDGDDWLEQDAVKCLVEVYQRENCLIISSYKDAYLENNLVKIDSSMVLVGPEGRISWKGYAKSYSPYLNLRSSCYKLFDMRIIAENDIYFDDTITHGEDGLFVCQYLQYVDYIYYLSKQLWIILNRPNSASRSNFTPTQLSMFRAIEKMEKVSNYDDDRLYFEHYKCERTYYYAWQLIISENKDKNSINILRKKLCSEAKKYLFGKNKLQSKAKYIYMLLWYACH